MKKLLLSALLLCGASVRSENIIFKAQEDPMVQQVVEEVVKPAAKVGFWALVGYITLTFKF